MPVPLSIQCITNMNTLYLIDLSPVLLSMVFNHAWTIGPFGAFAAVHTPR